jgi:hypothetical protein
MGRCGKGVRQVHYFLIRAGNQLVGRLALIDLRASQFKPSAQ